MSETRCTWCDQPATHTIDVIRHYSDGDSIAVTPVCDLGTAEAHAEYVLTGEAVL